MCEHLPQELEKLISGFRRFGDFIANCLNVTGQAGVVWQVAVLFAEFVQSAPSDALCAFVESFVFRAPVILVEMWASAVERPPIPGEGY
jgi:hypothetical protein